MDYFFPNSTPTCPNQISETTKRPLNLLCSVVWKKVPHFFSELNLLHDRIEPNKHLPKTNECHPKKGSIFNRTYIIFQPLIFSKPLICFPGGIHGPIHCIASYAPTSFQTVWMGQVFIVHPCHHRGGTSGHCTIFRHFWERLDLGSFFGRNLAVSGVMKYDTTLGPYRGNPSKFTIHWKLLGNDPLPFSQHFLRPMGTNHLYRRQTWKKYTPEKLKWQEKTKYLKMYLLLKPLIFHCHVGFQWGANLFWIVFFYGKNLRSTKSPENLQKNHVWFGEFT